MKGLTDVQARRFGTRIVKESHSTTVKFGRTNGTNCLHVQFKARPAEGDDKGSEQRAASQTFYEELEWDQHPNNQAHQRRKDKKNRPDRDIMDAVRNKEAA